MQMLSPLNLFMLYLNIIGKLLSYTMQSPVKKLKEIKKIENIFHIELIDIDFFYKVAIPMGWILRLFVWKHILQKILSDVLAL